MKKTRQRDRSVIRGVKSVLDLGNLLFDMNTLILFYNRSVMSCLKSESVFFVSDIMSHSVKYLCTRLCVFTD